MVVDKHGFSAAGLEFNCLSFIEREAIFGLLWLWLFIGCLDASCFSNGETFGRGGVHWFFGFL
jgi:hypothetical protein